MTDNADAMPEDVRLTEIRDRLNIDGWTDTQHMAADIKYLLDRIATAYTTGFDDARERAARRLREDRQESDPWGYVHAGTITAMQAAIRAIKPGEGDANGRKG